MKGWTFFNKNLTKNKKRNTFVPFIGNSTAINSSSQIYPDLSYSKNLKYFENFEDFFQPPKEGIFFFLAKQGNYL